MSWKQTKQATQSSINRRNIDRCVINMITKRDNEQLTNVIHWN